MIKTIIAVLSALFIIIFISTLFISGFNTNESVSDSSLNDKNQQSFDTAYENQIDGTDFRISMFDVKDSQKLKLFDNTKEKLTSDEFLDKHECQYLVSTGFIDKNGNHIGTFKNREGFISNSVKSDTLNGFLYLTNNIFNISNIVSEDAEIILQTGPVLVKDSSSADLSLKNDENARRIMAAINKKGGLFFIAIYDRKNSLRGPELAELPEIIKDLEEKLSFFVINAVNLDGGTHSVFITPDIKLIETSIVGGFFCVN